MKIVNLYTPVIKDFINPLLDELIDLDQYEKSKDTRLANAPTDTTICDGYIKNDMINEGDIIRILTPERTTYYVYLDGDFVDISYKVHEKS